MSSKRLDTAICIASYRSQVHMNHLYQLAAMMQCSHALGIKFGLHFADSSNLDWGRNMLLWTSIREGYDWCFFCDTDTFLAVPNMQASAAAVFRMLQAGNEAGAAAIAAPVPMRNRPGYNVVLEAHTPNERIAKPEEIKGVVRPVDRIGTAFMGVSCGWICKNWAWHEQKDPDAWFQTKPFLERAGIRHGDGPPETFLQPAKLGEDYGFCDGVAKRGGQVYSDGRIEPLHIHNSAELAGVRDLGVELFSCSNEPSMSSMD